MKVPCPWSPVPGPVFLNLQKVNWKIFFKNQDLSQKDVEAFFKVFSSWVPDSPELFLDVADYSHVFDGPVVALIGHYYDVFLDNSNGEWGILVSYKKNLDGSNVEKIKKTFDIFVQTITRIKEDSNLAIDFNDKKVRFTINDGGLVQNLEETFSEVEPILNQALENNVFKSQFILNSTKKFQINMKFEKAPF